jgi:DNA-binding transcriptional regulator YiaG
MHVSVETYLTWDSGRRVPPDDVLNRARVVAEGGQHILLPLHVLATELRVHVRTLRAAAVDGRLRAEFTARSYFGHPVAQATRADAQALVASRLGRSAHRLGCRRQLIEPPADYASRIIALRRRLRLTQSALARRVGAASKAVVYQWETRKQTPSAVFWTRLQRLTTCTADLTRPQPTPSVESGKRRRENGTLRAM